MPRQRGLSWRDFEILLWIFLTSFIRAIGGCKVPSLFSPAEQKKSIFDSFYTDIEIQTLNGCCCNKLFSIDFEVEIFMFSTECCVFSYVHEWGQLWYNIFYNILYRYPCREKVLEIWIRNYVNLRDLIAKISVKKITSYKIVNWNKCDLSDLSNKLSDCEGIRIRNFFIGAN